MRNKTEIKSLKKYGRYRKSLEQTKSGRRSSAKPYSVKESNCLESCLSVLPSSFSPIRKVRRHVLAMRYRTKWLSLDLLTETPQLVTQGYKWVL